MIPPDIKTNRPEIGAESWVSPADRELLASATGDPNSDATPERFDPASMRGQLIEAEHLARYHFAATSALGRRVLDAGCGWPYGADILAGAGATEVVGVDIATSVIEAAKAIAHPSVRLQAGDVRELPFEDNSFDMVTCFEVIEHIEGRETALAEFARILAPGGILFISSPNRDVYGERNEHHVFEYTPDEFREFLSTQFPFVRFLAQENWLTSLVCSLETLEQGDPAQIAELELRKSVGRPAGSETYMVGVASADPLPADLPQVGAMTFTTELLKWQELWEDQDSYLRRLLAAQQRLGWDTIVETDRRLAENQHLLVAAERRETELQGRISMLEQDVKTLLTAPVYRVLGRRWKRNPQVRRLLGLPPLS